MSKSPRDAKFNKALREELMGESQSEKVLFYDTDNNLREAIYPAEFDNGGLRATRQRLEGLGVLKAIVHVSAVGHGDPGPRVSVVEYLPDGVFYTTMVRPPLVTWGDLNESVIATAKEVFKRFDEEGDE